MILQKSISKLSIRWIAPVILYVTGITFCGVIWLVDIYFIVSDQNWNYYISISSPVLNYWFLCGIIFSGFCIIGFIFCIRKTSTLLTCALIISCLSIATNTVLLKKILKLGHRMEISRLEIYLQNDKIDMRSISYMRSIRYCETRYQKSVEEWNLVEDEVITPNTNLFGTYIRRLSSSNTVFDCMECGELFFGEDKKPIIETGRCPACNTPIME